jgi:hypothetical protein
MWRLDEIEIKDAFEEKEIKVTFVRKKSGRC